MRTIFITISVLVLLFLSCSQTESTVNTNENMFLAASQQDTSEWNKLTAEEAYVIVNKGTEYPGTGKYVDNHEKGIYQCKRCNTPLFTSESKFESGTGWPSFDDFIDSNVEIVKDADGYREEIVCGTCKGHLGHVFYNEGFTSKNTRHCVNSISLNFVAK